MALRKSFFHNGAIHSLEDAVRFYAQRDTQPWKWYPRKPDGTLDTFDDLPPRYRANVNTEPPFGGKPGDRPVLSEAEVRDIVAFLKTLTDGYRRAARWPSVDPPRRPGRCERDAASRWAGVRCGYHRRIRFVVRPTPFYVLAC